MGAPTAVKFVTLDAQGEIGIAIMCPETKRLVLKYHEATAVHSAFTQASEAQQKPGIENFLWQMEQARIGS